MEDLQKHLIPYRLPLRDYDGLVRFINEQNLNILRDMLPKLPKGICVILIGSDGKIEKHPQSKKDIVIIGKSINNAFSWSKKIKEHLYINFPQESFDYGRHGFPEHKAINSSILSYAFGNKQDVFPDRVLNSLLVAGDKEIYRMARLQTLQEMGGNDELGKRIIRHMHKQLEAYKKACKTGCYRGLTIFNLDTNRQIYNEGNIYGFKLAFIRGVQRKIDIIIAEAITQKRLDPITCIQEEMPTNTVERLRYLFDKDLIPSCSIRGLIDAYRWFLQRYHEIQETYKNKRKKVEVDFDPLLFKCYSDIILDFITTSYKVKN